MRPVVSEKDCPLETIYPIAADGHRGLAVLRKPSGPGPFPAIVWFHGGLTTFPLERLQARSRDLATGPRFLAAGYVYIAATYRSRNIDPQTADTVRDALATVEYLHKLPFVERQSIVVGGCSGGGDLALQVAARSDVCAVVAEEPASVLTTGLFNKSLPKQGERYTPADAFFLSLDGRRYYTEELQRTFRARATTNQRADLDCPGRCRPGRDPDQSIQCRRPDSETHRRQEHRFGRLDLRRRQLYLESRK
jgi:dienelactone hydrolase